MAENRPFCGYYMADLRELPSPGKVAPSIWPFFMVQVFPEGLYLNKTGCFDLILSVFALFLWCCFFEMAKNSTISRISLVECQYSTPFSDTSCILAEPSFHYFFNFTDIQRKLATFVS